MEYLDIMTSIDQSEFLSGTSFKPEAVTVKDFKKGDVIFDEVNSVPSIALIHSGEVFVCFMNEDNKKTIVNTLSQGSCFGISNLLFNHKLDTTLECKTDVTIIYIPKKEVVKAMENDAKLAMRYGAHCNEKISFLIKKIEFFTIQSAREKFIKFLLSNKNDDNTINLGIKREEIALKIGISRAALYREIKHLQNQNAIILTKSDIKICDEEILHSILKDCV